MHLKDLFGVKHFALLTSFHNKNQFDQIKSWNNNSQKKNV